MNAAQLVTSQLLSVKLVERGQSEAGGDLIAAD
jgi:hypothetical protein